MFLIAAGGALGTVARYGAALWAARVLGSTFPFGTLLVNIAGSFFIAFIMHMAAATELLSPNARLMLTTGVMGGFTTYSTFNYETTEYLREGAWMMAAANACATVIGCLAAGLAGLAVARLLFGR